MSTHSTLLEQAPPAPTFTPFLQGVYLLTNGGYLLSANNGGGVITDNAIQTQIEYSIGKGTDPFVDTINSALFNVLRGSNGQFAIQTQSGNYITAVDGGGRVTDVLHTDAKLVQGWEEFRIASTGSLGAFSVSIQTNSNNFLTAVGMGGKTTNAMHSDAVKVGTWETFFIRSYLGVDPANNEYFIVDTDKNQAIAPRQGGGQTQNTIQFLGKSGGVPLNWARLKIIPIPQRDRWNAFQTINGNFITAVNGGGLNSGTNSTDNIHTDASVASAWEQFLIVPGGSGSFRIQTNSGKFIGKRTSGGSAEGEYSTNADLSSASTFWLIPTIFYL